MKIAESSIVMQGSHTYLEKYEKSESLKMWVGDERPDFEGRSAKAAQLPAAKDFILELSEQAKAAMPVKQDHPAKQAESCKESGRAEEKDSWEIELSEEDKMKISLIERFIKALTGKDFKIETPDMKDGDSEEECRELQDKAAELEQAKQNQAQQNQAPQNQPPQKQGWGLEYEYHEKRYEQEKMSFSADGVIKTADGKEINFSVDLSMSREFMEEKNISIRAGDAVKVDPLVINYNGAAAELTNTKFSFDLDANGQAEQVSFVRPGSGFLALDKNGDGVINDGTELFGPASGNGFADLAKYDEDGNGWIDENDTIFDKLRIWSKDAEGNDYLFALGQKGIGAIYLGHIATPFAMKNQANELQGEVNKSGIYVKENGSVGTVQQIDLAV